MTCVSIIIPCRDDGKYLAEALASARGQTHPDCEILVIDDHSTDACTLKVLEELSAAGQPVLSLPSGKSGAAAARNWGIARARGQYILPLDADDRMEPTYAEKAAAVLDARPDVGICYCRADFFGLKRGAWRLPPYSFQRLLLHNMIFISAMFRKKDWESIGGFDEDTAAGYEDHIFWLMLAASGVQVHQLQETLFHYRIKARSRAATIRRCASERDIALKTFRGREHIYHDHLRLLFESCIDLDTERRQRERLFLWKVCRPLLAAEERLRNLVKRLLRR